MANLMSLPLELMRKILIQKSIEMEDVVNLSLTCKQMYMMINRRYLWRRKLFQRWPSLKKIHTDRLNKGEDIKEIVMEGLEYDKELLLELSHLPMIYRGKYTYKRLYEGEYNYLFNQRIVSSKWQAMFHPQHSTACLRYRYFHDKLVKLAHADPFGKNVNLTTMYYAINLLVVMRHTNLQNYWKYFSPHYEHMFSEEVATLVAQWFQPYTPVLHYDLSELLRNIVQQIVKVLKDVRPGHSIFAIPDEQFTFWENAIMEDNYWDAKESRQIIDIIGRVIFRELNFKVCCVNSDQTCVDPKCFFIDQVLESKNASPVLLQIIIQDVARRLGIRCDLLHAPNQLLLSWSESYEFEPDYYYIDLFSGGSLLRINNYLKCRPEEIDMHMLMTPLIPSMLIHYLTSKLDIVFRRNADKCLTESFMLYEFINILRQSIQFPAGIATSDASENEDSYSDVEYRSEDEQRERRQVSWCNADCIFECYCSSDDDSETFYDEDEIFDDETDVFSTVSEACLEKTPSCLTREHLKYTIGMLVEIESPFKTTGVIIGWKRECFNCDYVSWPKFDNVLQPFMCTQSYRILACHDLELNVYQEFLKPLKMQKWINNSEIGQYFSHFEGTHYVPNQNLRMLYPMDVNILEKKYSES